MAPPNREIPQKDATFASACYFATTRWSRVTLVNRFSSALCGEMGVEKRAASPAQDEDEELFYPVAGPAPKKRARKSKGGDEDQDEHEHEDTEKRLAIFKKSEHFSPVRHLVL